MYAGNQPGSIDSFLFLCLMISVNEPVTLTAARGVISCLKVFSSALVICKKKVQVYKKKKMQITFVRSGSKRLNCSLKADKTEEAF